MKVVDMNIEVLCDAFLISPFDSLPTGQAGAQGDNDVVLSEVGG